MTSFIALVQIADASDSQSLFLIMESGTRAAPVQLARKVK